jgi:hypothetical protein
MARFLPGRAVLSRAKFDAIGRAYLIRAANRRGLFGAMAKRGGPRRSPGKDDSDKTHGEGRGT